MEAERWTLEVALNEIGSLAASPHERSFCFILGSGASQQGGIPTGVELVDIWLEKLRGRSGQVADQPLESWATAERTGIHGFTYAARDRFYPEVFDRLYGGDKEVGYVELEQLTSKGRPTMGHVALTMLLTQTRHRVVITTNFDNLISRALAAIPTPDVLPLVCGHEALAQFIRVPARRPVVAKIHRDVLFAPRNDRLETSRLERGWKSTLDKILAHYTPVVVGYGGNDQSLMGYLRELSPDKISGRMIWCHLENQEPHEAVIEVIARHKGVLVPISGFDQFMLRLAAKIPDVDVLASLSQRPDWKSRQEIDEYCRQYAKVHREIALSGWPPEIERTATADLEWWKWVWWSESVSDFDIRSRVLEVGLYEFGECAELYGNLFLVYSHAANPARVLVRDRAEECWTKANELDKTLIRLANPDGLYKPGPAAFEAEIERRNQNARRRIDPEGNLDSLCRAALK